ncbi:MAG: hypothetical protein QM619_09300 [Micropruina sp.]|uniref:hypothetical protein n=1 Tax=Micropruina sp. TaxID=2737536 RepID=UPI0039E58B7B
MPPEYGYQPRTTLDLVLLAWLSGRKDESAKPPASQEELYRRVLWHEVDYWEKAYINTHGTTDQGESVPNRELLGQAGAIATLAQPSSLDVLTDLLRAIPLLNEDAHWRDEVARSIKVVLQSHSGEPMAIRPDPVADFHLITTFAEHQELLTASLSGLTGDKELERVFFVLSRAGQYNHEAAIGLVEHLIRARQPLWRPALNIAKLAPGAVRDTLERLAQAEDCPLPLDEVPKRFHSTTWAPIGSACWWIGDGLARCGTPLP